MGKSSVTDQEILNIVSLISTTLRDNDVDMSKSIYVCYSLMASLFTINGHSYETFQQFIEMMNKQIKKKWENE